MRPITDSLQNWLKSLDLNHIVAARGYVEMPLYGRVLLAIFVPWLQFFTLGRPLPGLICLVLQGSLIGWFPAMVWSLYTLYLHQGTPPDEMRETIQTALGRLAGDKRKPPEVMLQYAEEVAKKRGKKIPTWARATRSGCQVWIMANE
jgi:hypothetical protein